jgi:hypothetical protein
VHGAFHMCCGSRLRTPQLPVASPCDLAAGHQSRQPCSVSRKRTGSGITAGKWSVMDTASSALAHFSNMDSFTACSTCTGKKLTTNECQTLDGQRTAHPAPAFCGKASRFDKLLHPPQHTQHAAAGNPDGFHAHGVHLLHWLLWFPDQYTLEAQPVTQAWPQVDTPCTTAQTVSTCGRCHRRAVCKQRCSPQHVCVCCISHAMASKRTWRKRAPSRAPAQRRQAAEDAEGRQIQAAEPVERVGEVQRHARRRGTQGLRHRLHYQDTGSICHCNTAGTLLPSHDLACHAQ